MNTITNLNTFPIGNSLDGINIVSEEISTLSLLVDGSNYMLADLNMNNHIIKNLDAGVDSLDAVNKSQLDLKADTSYVNAQLLLKADKTYVDNSLNSLRSYTDSSLNSLRSYTDSSLNLLRSYTDSSLNLLRSYVNTQDSNLRSYIDSSLNSLRSYTDSSLNLLRSYTDSSLNLLRSYTDSSLNLLRNYTDSSLNSLRSYTDSSLNLLRTYVNSQDALKVNKSGDTMSGALVVNYNTASLDIRATDENQDSILYLSTPYQNGTTNRRKTAIIADGIGGWNRANLHFCLNQASTHNDVTISDSKMCIINNTGNVGIATTNPAEKLDINGNTKIRGILDVTSNKVINLAEPTLSQDATTKNYVDVSLNLLRSYVNTQDTAERVYVDASLNLKVNRAGDVMTGNLTINKNATNSRTSITSSDQTISLLSGTIYDFYDLTYVGDFYIHLVVFNKLDSTTTLANKTIYFKIPEGQALAFFTDPVGRSLNINGNNTNSFAMYDNFCLICSATPGYYTTGPYISPDTLSENQLTLKSNLGLNANSEFTEIKFLHTTEDAGIIECETDRDRANSVMRFYIRSSNNLILPLDIKNTINAYKPMIFSDTITANSPIIRNAWSSGELIKTTIFSRATTGVSKIANVNPSTGLDWLYPTLTLRNTPTNSIIVMDFDAPYHFTGAAQDTIELYVYDTTGGTANLVFAKSQYYDGAGGGGTRSGPIFPFSFSHTPSQATSTATRTYIITLYCRSTTDILKLCQGVFNGSVINLDYYTCEMREIKI